jgi:hypothetical protein
MSNLAPGGGWFSTAGTRSPARVGQAGAPLARADSRTGRAVPRGRRCAAGSTPSVVGAWPGRRFAACARRVPVSGDGVDVVANAASSAGVRPGASRSANSPAGPRCPSPWTRRRVAPCCAASSVHRVASRARPVQPRAPAARARARPPPTARCGHRWRRPRAPLFYEARRRAAAVHAARSLACSERGARSRQVRPRPAEERRRGVDVRARRRTRRRWARKAASRRLSRRAPAASKRVSRRALRGAAELSRRRSGGTVPGWGLRPRYRSSPERALR